MVKHVQGGFNGKGSELTIVVGIEEDEDGRFDKDRKRPVTFPLSVPGQKQEFASFDKYRLHLLQAVTSTTVHRDNGRSSICGLRRWVGALSANAASARQTVVSVDLRSL